MDAEKAFNKIQYLFMYMFVTIRNRRELLQTNVINEKKSVSNNIPKDEICILPPTIIDNARMSTLIISTQHCTGNPTSCNKA